MLGSNMPLTAVKLY